MPDMALVRDPLITDQLIDQMLTRPVDGLCDPLDHGLFPSLGFPNEQRGTYFIQVESPDGTIKVSVWRMVQANGAPDSYRATVYHYKEYNGCESWGGDSSKAVDLDSLLLVQAFIHRVITSEGNTQKLGDFR